MITFLKIFFGFKGTWFWACRKMQEGKTLYRFRDSGTAFFKYDKGHRKIISYVKWGAGESSQWLSMEDVFATDFKIQHVSSENQKQKIGCFATVVGKHTPHSFEIGTHVVIMSHDEKRAYVKAKSVSQGEYVLLKDLKDETL